MTFHRPTHVQHPQNRAEKLCPKQPLNVTLAQASSLACDGAGLKQLLLQLQFTHQLPCLPQALHFSAVVIAIADSIDPCLKPLDQRSTGRARNSEAH
jgi:hypothetical protein